MGIEFDTFVVWRGRDFWMHVVGFEEDALMAYCIGELSCLAFIVVSGGRVGGFARRSKGRGPECGNEEQGENGFGHGEPPIRTSI